MPGNGDGTFGTPVLFGSIADGSTGNPLLTADLNQDGKLDLIWPGQEGAVFLGNGDGTFNQIPLGTTYESLCAVADMNGDGYPDLITCDPGAVNIYAGNGDGTFQTASFYPVQIPIYYLVQSAAVGDINGDGNPDLVIYDYYSGLSDLAGPSQLLVAYGNGKGAFTQDTNTYFAGYTRAPGQALLTRLNNNAPSPSSDHALDALVFTGPGLTGMLNQENQAPAAPPILTSSLTLQSSATSANENASITLSATVLGTDPTGSVVFSANGTSLGTAPLTNGTATLQISFTSAGTYAVTANYQGDENNSASTSNTVSITVAAPDFTVASSPMSATITAGQTATFSLTLTPVGGFSGTVNLSCGSLPSEATCSFSPSTLTPANGAAATGTLTIATTAAVAALHPPAGSQLPWIPAGSLALAGAVGLLISPKRLTQWNRRLWMLASAILLSGAWFSLTGCGGSSSTNGNPAKNPGTPSGTYTVTVNLSDSAGPTHSLALKVTIQ